MFIGGGREEKEEEIITLFSTSIPWKNVELTVCNTDGTLSSFHSAPYCPSIILLNLSPNFNVCLHTVEQVLILDALFSGLDIY